MKQLNSWWAGNSLIASCQSSSKYPTLFSPSFGYQRSWWSWQETYVAGFYWHEPFQHECLHFPFERFLGCLCLGVTLMQILFNTGFIICTMLVKQGQSSLLECEQSEWLWIVDFRMKNRLDTWVFIWKTDWMQCFFSSWTLTRQNNQTNTSRYCSQSQANSCTSTFNWMLTELCALSMLHSFHCRLWPRSTGRSQ